MDFKVRCLTSFSNDITKGKIYEIHNGRFCFDDGDKVGTYENFKELEQHFGSKFELVTDRPILAAHLNVEVNKPFKIIGWAQEIFIDSKGVAMNLRGSISDEAIFDAIQHPEKIIRQPQFSEDEKALMRLCGDNGYWTYIRCEDTDLRVKQFLSEYGKRLPSFLLPQVTRDNSPFDAKTYLEGLK